MTYPVFLPRYWPFAVHCLLGLFGPILIYAFPPEEGRLLLVPVTGEGRAMLASVAVANGARLVAAGPVAGSLLVEGQRDVLARPLLMHGVLLLAAQAGGCEGGQA